MHRIDAADHVNNRFSEGSPQTGQPGTVVSADWLNAVQEELVAFITGMGLSLDKSNNGQLFAALLAFLSRPNAWASRQTFDGGITVPASVAGSMDACRRAELDAAVSGLIPVTRAMMMPLGQQVSGSCGNWESTVYEFVDVPNLALSIVTTGRPVMLSLQPDGSAGWSVLAVESPGELHLQVLRDGAPLGVHVTQGVVPPGCISMVDTPRPAATPTQFR